MFSLTVAECGLESSNGWEYCPNMTHLLRTDHSFGVLLLISALTVCTETLLTAWLLILFFFTVLNFVQTSSRFFFCLLERWNTSVPVRLRHFPGKQGASQKLLHSGSHDLEPGWITTRCDRLSMQIFSFMLVSEHGRKVRYLVFSPDYHRKNPLKENLKILLLIKILLQVRLCLQHFLTQMQ